jgi:hypothetical protein
MAHWHDFNPWATEVVYIPSLEEIAACLERPEQQIQRWKEQAVRYNGDERLLDAYILRDGIRARVRECHVGIRWGKSPEQYFSPYVADQSIALLLWKKFGAST